MCLSFENWKPVNSTMTTEGMHCLLGQNRFFFFIENHKIFLGEIITCNPSIYTMEHPYLNESSFIEYQIGLKRI